MDEGRTGAREPGGRLSLGRHRDRQGLAGEALGEPDSGCLDLPRRLVPDRRRGQKPVLVLGGPFRVRVPVHEDLRELRPVDRSSPGRLGFMAVAVVLEEMRLRPDELRHRGDGEEQKDGRESTP